MQVRYFVVDDTGVIRKAPQSRIEGVWADRRPASDLGRWVDRDLRIITVVCNDHLEPVWVYFVRVAIHNNRITPASRLIAHQAVTGGAEDKQLQKIMAFQATGWPIDWQRQLAVAMDAPRRQLDRIDLGGPLPMSDLLGVSVGCLLRKIQRGAVRPG